MRIEGGNVCERPEEVGDTEIGTVLMSSTSLLSAYCMPGTRDLTMGLSRVCKTVNG